MAGTKLNLLKQEIEHYLGLPYFKNVGKFKNSGDNAYVGKGSAKEIALATIDRANQENIKLIDFTPQQMYNFQKKHHLGIDCSGLAVHLLNFYFDTNIDPRKTSADMLTSTPLSKKIKISEATTADLIRQEDGHHVLFVIEKINDQIYYIDSSLKGRGVKFGQLPISPQLVLYRLAVQSK